MNFKFKSLLCLLLIFATLFVVVGCNGGNKGGGGETAPGGEDTTPVEKEDPWVNYPQQIGVKNFDGAQFTIASVEHEESSFFTGWCGEELSSYPVADSIFKRDQQMYENYGVDVNYKMYPRDDGKTLASTLQTAIQGDTYICDMINSNLDDSIKVLFNANCLYDINSLEYVNPFTTPWWASYFSEGASFQNRLYYAASMASGGAYFGTAYIMMCNLKLQQDIYLEDGTQMDILQLIEDDQWTLETMDEIIEACFALGYPDKASSVSVYEDMMVYANCNNNTTAAPHYIAAGGKFSTIDTNGNIVVDLATEEVQALTSKLSAIFAKVEHNYDQEAYFKQKPSQQIKSFLNDKALFFGNSMTYVDDLTEMASDYAIIPCPMANCAQGEYLSGINPWSPGFIAVPGNIANKEMVGYAIEMLGYHSYYTVKPIVYEETLCLRMARDPQQIAVMDEIFSNLYVDLNFLNNFGTSFTAVASACHDVDANIIKEINAIRSMDKDINKFVNKMS